MLATRTGGTRRGGKLAIHFPLLTLLGQRITEHPRREKSRLYFKSSLAEVLLRPCAVVYVFSSLFVAEQYLAAAQTAIDNQATRDMMSSTFDGGKETYRLSRRRLRSLGKRKQVSHCRFCLHIAKLAMFSLPHTRAQTKWSPRPGEKNIPKIPYCAPRRRLTDQRENEIFFGGITHSANLITTLTSWRVSCVVSPLLVKDVLYVFRLATNSLAGDCRERCTRIF